MQATFGPGVVERACLRRRSGLLLASPTALGVNARGTHVPPPSPSGVGGVGSCDHHSPRFPCRSKRRCSVVWGLQLG